MLLSKWDSTSQWDSSPLWHSSVCTGAAIIPQGGGNTAGIPQHLHASHEALQQCTQFKIFWFFILSQTIMESWYGHTPMFCFWSGWMLVVRWRYMLLFSLLKNNNSCFMLFLSWGVLDSGRHEIHIIHVSHESSNMDYQQMSKREQINVLPEALALRYMASPSPTAAHPREAPAQQAWELLLSEKSFRYTLVSHTGPRCVSVWYLHGKGHFWKA